MRVFKIDLLVLVITSIIAIITNINYVYYISFVIVSTIHILNFSKGKSKSIETIFYLTLYSCILPDNYTTMMFSFLLLCLLVFKEGKEIKNYIVNVKEHRTFIVICILAIINIVVNRVSIINIALYLTYSFTFYTVYIFFKLRYNDKNFIGYVNIIFNTIILLELIHTLLFAMLRTSVVIKNIYGDWSIGTFGLSHGYVLFILICFAAIKYFHEYNITKEKKYLVLIFLCFLTAVSTVNVSLTIMAFASLAVYIFISKISARMKLSLAGVLILFVFLFWQISIPMIRWQIINAFTNKQFIAERVKKLKGYENTFITIPSNDFKFLLIGNGIGNYSSRAALTATGYYIPSFNKIFRPNISYYTSVYMHPEIYAERDISIQQMPTSQIISIMGEMGIIGLVFILYLLVSLIKKSYEVNKLILLFFFFLCFIDNWLEYAKVGTFLWVAYFIIEYKARNEVK